VDRFSRWLEALPVKNITAETIAQRLFRDWMTRYGVPVKITTDQGRQFEAKLFQQLTRLTGTIHLRIMAYHPEANGLVEACVKLAPHLLAPQVMTQVLFAPAIVLQFLIGFRNSSVDLAKKNEI